MAVEQLGVELALAVDQRRLGAAALRDLDEALRVRARLRADHEDERRALRDDLLDRVLPVLGRVADVVRARPLSSPKRRSSASTVGATSSSDSVVCVITATGLPSVSSSRGLLGRLDHDRRVRPLAARADHLDVVGVADERDEVAAVGVAPRLGVHLGDERADGVDDAAGRASRSSPCTAGATPCAERTQISPAGISSSCSTKTAPSPSSRRTTWSLWTIWWRT